MFTRIKEKGVSSRMLGATVLAVAILAISGCGNLYVHEEFEKLTMNKTDAEVTTIIGKPTAVDVSDPAHVTWTYYSKTIDIDNENKRDMKTVLTLAPDSATHNLKVVKVQYLKS